MVSKGEEAGEEAGGRQGPDLAGLRMAPTVGFIPASVPARSRTSFSDPLNAQHRALLRGNFQQILNS